MDCPFTKEPLKKVFSLTRGIGKWEGLSLVEAPKDGGKTQYW